MSNKDFKSDLEMWMDVWADCEKEQMHPQPERPKPAAYSPEAQHTTAQDTYYDYLDHEELLSEMRKPAKPAQPQRRPAVRPAARPAARPQARRPLQEGKSMNPVYPDSVGPDNEGPKPAWVNENLVKEVEKLKNKLFAVENKLARMGQGKSWTEKVVNDDGKALMSEIRSIKQRLDRVSSHLGIQDEPSPWQTPKRG